jgi:hypothetical protein
MSSKKKSFGSSKQMQAQLLALQGIKSKSARRRAKAKQSKGNTVSSHSGMQISSSAVPVAYTTRTERTTPVVSRREAGCNVKNTELVVASIPGSTTFVPQFTIPLNPGLASVFPWLSPQAIQYQRYRCNRLRVIYVAFSPTSVAGDVLLAPIYDASQPVTGSTEQQLSSNKNSVEDNIFKRIEIDLNVSALHGGATTKWVRPCAQFGDIKTFDMGNLVVGTNNCANTNAIGKLFFEYDFDFFDPQSGPSPSSFPSQTSSFSLHNGDQSFTNSVPAVIAWDTVQTGDALKWFSTNSSGTFTPPAGCYRFHCFFTSRDSANENFTTTIALLKNGAGLTPNVSSSCTETYGAANGYMQTVLHGIVALNGTDTFAIQADIIGAAGTLRGVVDRCGLVIELA